jgi:hypothetical protein
MLCGCKMQVDWRMFPQDQCFHNLFGAGSETRSEVAHNTNEHMRPNQHGRCAMMALGTLSPEVVNSGIDSTGLGRWCWIHLGSGTKEIQIVMAYQPSNSRRSAETTIKVKHSRYFCALGGARSPRTICFEQLVSQLIPWKAIDNDIILLGYFNENIYTGCLAGCLAQDCLNFTKICRHHTASQFLQCVGTEVHQSRKKIATLGIKIVNTFILPRLSGNGNH